MLRVTGPEEHISSHNRPHISRVDRKRHNLLITSRVHKRLAAILRPQLRIIERGRIPHYLVHDLGQSDRMGGGTGASTLEGSGLGIRHVGFVIGAINSLSIPAGREGDCRPDAATTHFLGKGRGIISGTRGATEGVLLHVAEAAVAELALLPLGRAEGRVADEHTETLVLVSVQVVMHLRHC